MGFRVAEARKELQAFDLKKLFIEQMGWDRPGADITIRFNEQGLRLKAIAQKRGLGAFIVPPIEEKIPDYATRRKIEVDNPILCVQHQHTITHRFHNRRPRHGNKIKNTVAMQPPCEDNAGENKGKRCEVQAR